MEKYLNRGGNSGVKYYRIGEESITVIFGSTSREYVYSYLSAGVEHVEKMKVLAVTGRGLNTYINKYVSKKYVK